MSRSLIYLTFAMALLSFEQGIAHHHDYYYHHDYYHHDHYYVEPSPVVYVQPSPVVVEPASPNVIYVEQQPPADQVEVMGTSPGPAYVWVGGYWKWNGGWKWKKGEWTLKPAGMAEWKPGHWKEHHGRWEWKEGHWR